MYSTKKVSPFRRVIGMILFCFAADCIMLGLYFSRYILWGSLAYMVTLTIAAPLWMLFLAGWCALLINTLMSGQVITELAQIVLLGVIGNFLAERTLPLSFARRILATLLAVTCVLLSIAAPGQLLNLWTGLRIIANIIIINLLLKYTS